MYKYKRFLPLSLVYLLLFFIWPLSAQNKIYQLRSNALADKLQIVIELDSIPKFKAFALSEPVRIVVDVQAQAATTYQNNLSFKKRGVTVVRTGMQNTDTVRFVLDLNQDYHWKAYTLAADKKQRPPRLVIDVFDGKRQTLAKKQVQTPNLIVLESVNNTPEKSSVSVTKVQQKTIAASKKDSTSEAIKAVKVISPQPISKTPIKKKAVAKKPPKKPKTTAKSTIKKPLKHKEIIVMIDPGHGGKDSGAVGKNRSLEKVIVLQIAKRLKKKIDAIPNMKAVLTRSTDRYISLRGRLRLARKHKADLFVSIHADAALRRTARGSSVYILSNRGASSESARWLAQRENASDLKFGVDIGDYDKDVSNMIMQIQQDATIESSYLLAKKTIQQMKHIGKVHKPHVERAGFAVLKSPDIPSMLVETAFISNPEEERRLKTAAYQEKIATSIAKGIQAYFAEHMPQHLMLSNK